MWWIRVIHNWNLTSENKQTKVIVKESLKGFLSVGMLNSLKAGMKKNLAELKKRAEHFSKL